MNYLDFLKEFKPIIDVFGGQHFQAPILERIHFKIRDMPLAQRQDLYSLILDSCEYAPKVPRVVELANIIRARHREGIGATTPDTDPRTPEVAKQALATITDILSRKPR